MADLPTLLAQLANSSAATASSRNFSQERSNYHPPTVSSPIASPTPGNQPPRHAENIMSMSTTPAPVAKDGPAAEKNNLLNLLKFSGPSPSQGAAATASTAGAAPMLPTASLQARPAHASNLLASFASSKPAQPDSTATPTASVPLHSPKASTGTAALDNPQNALLDLLKNSDPEPSVSRNTLILERERAERELTPIRMFGADGNAQSAPFEAPTSRSNGNKFNAVNPFEQLTAAAASARSPGPSAMASSGPQSPVPVDANSTGRSNLEALLGIGERSAPSETVAAALKGVAGQVNKQAKDALIQLEAESPKHQQGHQPSQAEVKDAVHDAAKEVREEFRDGKTREEVEEGIPKSVNDALQDTRDAAAQEPVADSWESVDADDEGVKEQGEYLVRVYNLPMKPFVSLNVRQAGMQVSHIRPDVVMKIASFKKGFDQIDRNLASASNNFIVYSMAKGGGFRVIRQDDGKNCSGFRDPQNTVFNVSICPPSPGTSETNETILATGVNGSVFWTRVPPRRIHDSPILDFDKYNMDAEGFIFTAPPLAEEQISTTQQRKTRAKQSTCHAEFFGISRGKNLFLIWPETAMSEGYLDSRTRVVDSAKYVRERCVKIAMGKAGKDFVFSGDDSVVASLDKVGHLKFWNISSVLDADYARLPDAQPPIEFDTPMLVFEVAFGSQKAQPTSIMFLDKERPMHNRTALRYMLVGLKQNHTLQLWDIGLEKAVQEITLPHAGELDAFCSVAYHPKSSMITVGHPGRNSMFFIHLSAPRYALKSMSQATFIRAIADKSKKRSPPESTAIMSGIREVSLSSMGDLRSLDVASPNPLPTESTSDGDETVFEVYAMMSKGVTCLNLKRQDLGWGPDGKVISVLDAEAHDAVSVSELPVPGTGSDEGGTHDDKKTFQLETTKDSNGHALSSHPQIKQESPLPASHTSTLLHTNGESKSEKRGRKQKDVSQGEPLTASEASANVSHVKRESVERSIERAVEEVALQNATQPSTQVGDLSSLLEKSLGALYKRFDDDKRVQEASAAARQDAMLRLVASTLTDNVEKSLQSIVSRSIQETVLPAISSMTASKLDRALPDVISKQLQASIPKELKATLPVTLAKPELIKTISESLSPKLVPALSKQLSGLLKNELSPQFRSLAGDAAKKAAEDAEKRVTNAAKQSSQNSSAQESKKIEQLTKTIDRLSGTISGMADAQKQLQKDLTDLRGEVAQYQQAASVEKEAASRQVQPTVKPAVPQDAELDALRDLMDTGRHEEATIKWLQSARQAEMFDKLFVNVNPMYLQSINQIVLLSVCAAISVSLGSHLDARLKWLDVVLGSLDTRAPELGEYAPGVMDKLTERLADTYMRIAEDSPGSAVLSRIAGLVKQAKELKAAAG